MKGLFNYIVVALKGFGMGAANVVPGVSGGTIALLTGIYTELIEALNALMVPATWKMVLQGKWKAFWEEIHGNFLLALLAGVGISIFSLAKLMEYVIVYHPVQTWAFFFGLIIASAVYMLLDIKDWKGKDILWALLGGVLGVTICTLSPTQTPDDLWFIFLCGAIAICTMILPGISGSFILVILGKYEFIMNALNTLNWPVLIVFAIGCVIGILAFAKFLHWLLGRYERQTMLVLVGFVLGSLVKVWPWNDMQAVYKAEFLHQGLSPDVAAEAAATLATGGVPLQEATGMMHIPGAILWAIAGIVLVVLLEVLSKKTPQA